MEIPLILTIYIRSKIYEASKTEMGYFMRENLAIIVCSFPISSQEKRLDSEYSTLSACLEALFCILSISRLIVPVFKNNSPEILEPCYLS